MDVRIFNHTKQYACTEVFRLDDLQNIAQELEDSGDIDDTITFIRGRKLQRQMLSASRSITKFVKYLEEQEKIK